MASSDSGPTPGSSTSPTLIRLPGYPLFLAACFRLFGMENYRAVLHVQVAVDLVHLLSGQRAGRTPVWPPRAAAGSVDRGALPVHRELHRHGARRDAGVRHHRARLLRLCALAGCGPGLQPLAVDHRCRARLFHPAAAGAGSARRRGAAGDAMAILGDARTARPAARWRCRCWRRRSASRFRWCPGRHATHTLPCLSAAGAARRQRSGRASNCTASATGTAPGRSTSRRPTKSAGPWTANPSTFAALPDRAFDAGTPAASADLRRRTAALFADYNAQPRADPGDRRPLRRACHGADPRAPGALLLWPAHRPGARHGPAPAHRDDADRG